MTLLTDKSPLPTMNSKTPLTLFQQGTIIPFRILPNLIYPIARQYPILQFGTFANNSLTIANLLPLTL